MGIMAQQEENHTRKETGGEMSRALNKYTTVERRKIGSRPLRKREEKISSKNPRRVKNNTLCRHFERVKGAAEQTKQA